MNYYNDNDKFCVQWLKNLIDAKLIPNGKVDDRSITDIEPNDLEGFKQCHFFAGIGGWSYALRLAGWPDDREVWTGSCPCQPFSVAGKGGGTDDERHLWPAFRWLIAQRRPATVFGEQVASADGRLWLTGVRTDLEAMGFTVGAADLCAAGVGAPHIRQRLWWVADTDKQRGGRRGIQRPGKSESALPWKSQQRFEGFCSDDGLGNSSRQGLPQRRSNGRVQPETMEPPKGQAAICTSNGLGITAELRRRQKHQNTRGGIAGSEPEGRMQRPWDHSITIPCADGKWRRVPARVADTKHASATRQRKHGRESAHKPEPKRTGTSVDQCEYEIEPLLFPLADGLPNRVGALRGAGNAIVPQVAAEFIMAFMECE